MSSDFTPPAPPAYTPVPDGASPAAISALNMQVLQSLGICTASGRPQGLMGSFMAVAAFATLTGNAALFVMAPHPGPQAPPPAGATGSAIKELTRLYQTALKAAVYEKACIDQVREALFKAAPDFLDHLTDIHFGFLNVTLRQCQEELAAYLTPSDDDILEYQGKLDTAFDTSGSFLARIKIIKQVQAFSIAAGDPISDATAIRHTIKVLKATNEFKTAIHEWSNKPAAEKTMPNFKSHFTDADKKCRDEATACSASYGSAHLATALTAPDEVSTAELLHEFRAYMSTRGRGEDVSMFSYCWTHGLITNMDHSSASCTHKKRGHQNDATLSNMKGGNNTIFRPRGEVVVWNADLPPQN